MRVPEDASTIDRRLYGCHQSRYHLLSRLRGQRILGAGQFQREFAARPWPAVDEHPPAVGFGDLLHDVKADSQAQEMAGCLGLDPGEALEELALVLGVDAKAVVEDADGPVGARPAQGDVDPAGGSWPKADGVVE